MEGDTTNFYIFRKLASVEVKITTIARGVANGDSWSMLMKLHWEDQIESC